MVGEKSDVKGCLQVINFGVISVLIKFLWASKKNKKTKRQ